MNHHKSAHYVKLAAFLAYFASIPVANWLIDNVGKVRFPNGPHVIPVGFGYEAPSGVLAIGFALVARDYVQNRLGRRYALTAIAIGVALSFLVNRDLALASGLAFAFGELSDFAVYTPIRRHSMFVAVALSGIVGGVVDSLIFLQIAFGSVDYWQGQVIGKTWMALVGALVLALMRRQRGLGNVGVAA
jgi:uncharacterized PurR-regulated membrane protein YhhQ (DUF165 family)